MLQKLVVLSTLCMYSSILSAQSDSAKTGKNQSLRISGYADAYYKMDFAKTASNNKTSFTHSTHSFELGMASVKLEKTIGKAGIVADLGFGKRAREFAYNDEGITQAIKQLFVTYAAGDHLTFTAGSWATHVGYELADPNLNRNYSMSYMFSYGPFTHTGLKAEYKTGNTGLMLGLSNPTDFRTTALSPKYLIGQLSTASKNGALKLYLNYVGGKSSATQKMNQFDLVATLGINDALSLGLNGTLASYRTKTGAKYGSADSWWGTAVYLNAETGKKTGLTLRTELFSDQKQLNVFSTWTGTGGGTIVANTLSGNIRLAEGLTLIPELRIDHAEKALFTNSGGAGVRTAANILMAAVYAF